MYSSVKSYIATEVHLSTIQLTNAAVNQLHITAVTLSIVNCHVLGVGVTLVV